MSDLPPPFSLEVGAPVDIGNRAGFIAQMVGEGLSSNRILSTLAEAGAGMRRATGLAMIAEIRDGIYRSGPIMALDPSLVPPADMLSTWTVAGQPGYAYQMTMFVRDRDLEQVRQQSWTVVTTDLIPPSQAVLVGIGDMVDSAPEYDEQIMGGVVTNIYEMQTRPRR